MYSSLQSGALLCLLFQEIVLGLSSLTALGPIGAAVEIVIILYPYTSMSESSSQISKTNQE